MGKVAIWAERVSNIELKVESCQPEAGPPLAEKFRICEPLLFLERVARFGGTPKNASTRQLAGMPFLGEKA